MIPTPGQADVLHEAHPGFTRLKRLARTFDIEVKVVVWNARVFSLHLASNLEVGSLALGLVCMLIWQDHSWATFLLIDAHSKWM